MSSVSEHAHGEPGVLRGSLENSVVPMTQPLTIDDAVFERLLRQRIIFLGTEVDNDVANRICGQLLLLAAEDDRRDISLWINSPGGSVDAGLAIYDIMQFIRNDVSTVVMGMAASMGQVLLCAGAPGKRFALPSARVLMHQPHGGVGGTASDIAIQAEQMVHAKRTVQMLIARHTGQTFERVEEESDRDRWFTAEEAVAYGFVDRVVSSALEASAAGA
jgi:ATP-dependent Clp protease, protease subunit